MKYLQTLTIVALLLITQSCATLFSGTKQTVKLGSNPPGADIYVNNVSIGKQTPAKIKINRKVHRSSYNNKNEYNYTFKTLLKTHVFTVILCHIICNQVLQMTRFTL
jgi:hypothetical protein